MYIYVFLQTLYASFSNLEAGIQLHFYIFDFNMDYLVLQTYINVTLCNQQPGFYLYFFQILKRNPD